MQTHLREELHAVFKQNPMAFLNKLELHTFKSPGNSSHDLESILNFHIIEALRVQETKISVYATMLR